MGEVLLHCNPHLEHHNDIPILYDVITSSEL